MRTTFRTVFVVGLAVGLLALFLRHADVGQVADVVAAAHWGLLALAAALTVVVYVLRTLRWQYLLEPLGPTRFGNAFRATVLGFAASFVLPARVGEVLRPYLLARREGLDATAAFATVVLERVLDLVSVLLMLAVYLLFVDGDAARRAPALYEAVRLGAWIATPCALGAVALMIALAGRPDRVERVLLRVEARLPAAIAGRLARAGRTFAEGLVAVRRPARLLAALAWSLVIWVVLCSETWLVAQALGLDLPYAGTYLIMVLLVIGVAVPTPGGVGGFHEAFRLGATAFFAADNDVAVATAIVLHAVSFAPVLLLGLWAAAHEGLGFGALPRLQREERTSA